VNEIFPCVAGAAAGLFVARALSVRWRLPALIVLSVIIGVIASTISGEVELSLGFIPVDVLQAFGLGILALGLAMLWERRAFRMRRPF